jgi:cytoskeleton protein RodZ
MSNAAHGPVNDLAALGVGKALAEARQAQGLALTDVAQHLKFMTRQIEAIEAERFESLPGPTIARGMVRTYARFLKLDPEPLLAAMTGSVDTRDATPHLAARFSQPVPFSDSGKRSTVLYLGLSAMVLAIAGGMVYEWRHDRSAGEPVAAAPTQASEPAEAERPAPEPVAAQAVPEAAPKIAPKAAVIADNKSAAVALPPLRSETPAPPPSPLAVKEAAAPKSAEPKSTGPNRLVLRFEEAAWAEVIDSAGRQLISSLNPAGSERVVRGRPPYNIVIGNAQHVKVRYNEREIDLQPHVKVEVARFTLK